MSKREGAHRRNRLAGEKSPYLLQHAANPVDWYPWGEEAFEKARREDKPIFLSIGYATCHWCHVMERESFEDEDVAGQLNEHFVPVKVDREERPDVDSIYMTALTQVMQQQGGWPLSMWLTPDLQPFYGGTYFPPDDRFGRPAFGRVLERVAALWRERRSEIVDDAGRVSDGVRRVGELGAEGALRTELLDTAFAKIERAFDGRHGGFGRAPKFPQPYVAAFLLRYAIRARNRQAFDMVQFQLDHMAAGGIYDHLGGGFARYSTDEKWLVPHFEKMLYDNAQLLRLYAEAWQLMRKPLYEEIARETAGYVLRDMTDASGGFYSAEDADSEGVEGHFYVWRRPEVESLLGPENARLFGLAYDVTEEGNWDEPHSNDRGLNILHVRYTPEQIATLEQLDPAHVRMTLAEAKRRLYEERTKRVRPLRDDKILTSWNGLMISGLATAGRILGEPSYVRAAEGAAAFVRDRLWVDRRLLRRYRDGDARHDGCLDDYAFLAQGLLDLYEASLDPAHLQFASSVVDVCTALFWDDSDGGFFYTREGDPSLIVRSKNFFDNAVPSANAVAALSMLRLSDMSGDGRLRERARRAIEACARFLDELPLGCAASLSALDFLAGPSRQIVIAGDVDSDATKRMMREVQSRLTPRSVLFLASPGLDPESFPVVRGKVAIGGAPTAYVCEGATCLAPMTDLDELNALLEKDLSIGVRPRQEDDSRPAPTTENKHGGGKQCAC